jgi:hypothetical protein
MTQMIAVDFFIDGHQCINSAKDDTPLIFSLAKWRHLIYFNK